MDRKISGRLLVAAAIDQRMLVRTVHDGSSNFAVWALDAANTKLGTEFRNCAEVADLVRDAYVEAREAVRQPIATAQG